MKSIRVLLAVSVFALCAGIAAANCGTCDKKDQSAADKAPCAENCDKAKGCCGKDCQCPECTKACADADKAKCECPKDCQCPKCKETGAKCEQPKDEAKK